MVVLRKKCSLLVSSSVSLVQCWKNVMRKREIYLVLFISFLISNCAHCQIVENGIRITDLWLKFLFDTFPQYFPGNLMSTPVLFLPQVRNGSLLYIAPKCVSLIISRTFTYMNIKLECIERNQNKSKQMKINDVFYCFTSKA